ncbi:MAG: N-acetylneuraminate synthase family protein, partial [Dysgonamonadaceae bacterium]|nr:N-acetylneuraminate synthase family protein [Dysgonamonadaceae bacterium]
MASLSLRDSTVIGDYKKPYIVAEVNTSHGGNVESAMAMIDKAKEVGCNCVKFQSWSTNSLYSKSFYEKNPIAKRFVEKYSLSENDLFELARYCRDQNIAFASTPYSRREVDFLVDSCKTPFVKVASMDINNYPYLDYIAKTGAPIVLSTGMSEIGEIQRAVSVIENAGNNNICLLHCVSIYPADISTIHLNNIIGLREEFPQYPIGFSDHTLGIEVATAATALGAAVIEKHFTLDRKKIGMDNQMAVEPEEMALLVQSCHNVYLALGSKDRFVSEEEYEQRKKMRRSIVAVKNLEAGAVISGSDLDVKRPGTGLAPEKIDTLIGKRLLRSIEADTLLLETD